MSRQKPEIAKQRKLQAEVKQLKNVLKSSEQKLKAAEQTWKAKMDKVLSDAKRQIIAAELAGFNSGLMEGKKIVALKEKAVRLAGSKVEKMHAKSLKTLKAQKTAEATRKADALKKATAKKKRPAKAKVKAAKPAKKARAARMESRGPVSSAQRPARQPQRPQAPKQPQLKVAMGAPANKPAPSQSSVSNSNLSTGDNTGGMGENNM